MEVKRRANGQFKESGNPKTQFKKGDIPNPNGRNGALADIINKVFDEEVDEKTKKELMIRKVYRMAMNGSLCTMDDGGFDESRVLMVSGTLKYLLLT